MSVKIPKLGPLHATLSNWFQPSNALYFTSTLANHRPELILGNSVSQSAARIPSYEPCETLPCSSHFHDRLVAPSVFILNALPRFHLRDFNIGLARFQLKDPCRYNNFLK